MDKSSFAPSGPPKPAQSRVPKLLSPLRIPGHRRSRTLTALQDVCTAAASLQVSSSENDRFLDRFRYTIISSQLLDHEAKTTVDTTHSDTLREKETLQFNADKSFSLQGAVATIAVSFSMAWILQCAKASSSVSAVNWLNACMFLVFILTLTIGVYGYARRKASQRLRHAAVGTLSEMITKSHTLDNAARSAIGLIQEVEIVSKGYEINSPLPPISRLESKGCDRRCLALRAGVANAVSAMIRCYLEAHNVMLPFVDPIDMQRYHDIYEVSRHDYQEMIQGIDPKPEDDAESLKGLKTSVARLFVARQILLCDLLALPSTSSIPDARRWSVISNEIATLSTAVEISVNSISRLMNEEENRHWGNQSRGRSWDSTEAGGSHTSDIVPPMTPGKERAQAQLRRLDALSQSVRSLNARMLLLRDEANNLMDGAAQSSEVSSVLARQYDLIGGDLKSLMLEWERGRNTMLLGVGAIDRSSLSRSSSGLRSPRSPVDSLGGITAVNDGSPAEALRRLTGENLRAPSNERLGSDEEVFEAISLSVKSKRLSMTREEKLAKMQEERRKRATQQESRDATTNMLRELETVIKHRPRGRTTSRITSV